MKTCAYLILVLASLALYGVALFLPALQFEARAPIKGITTLMWGWWDCIWQQSHKDTAGFLTA